MLPKGKNPPWTALTICLIRVTVPTMKLFPRLALLVALASPSLFACASAEPVTEGSSDEDFTGAADASEPLRAELITALKKTNRTSLLPTSTIAYVYRPGAMDAVILKQKYSTGDAPGTTELSAARETLKTRGFKIVGKTAPYKDCEFSKANDYLSMVKSPTFLTKAMEAVNFATDGSVYNAADFAAAKAIEASITYKLVLTSERMAIYLGKQGGKWKIIAIDQAEYSCEA